MVVISFFLANLIGETALTLELTSYLQTSFILYVKSQSTPQTMQHLQVIHPLAFLVSWTRITPCELHVTNFD